MPVCFTEHARKTGAYRLAKPLRNIDFENFAFPWIDDVLGRGSFKLRNGELEAARDKRGAITGIGVILGGVTYADLDRDGREDAIVVMSVVTGGSATPNWIYVYMRRADSIVPMVVFETGDRADYGLRDVYADRGELVLELFSPEGAQGDCCPIKFLRRRYRWVGNAFCPVNRPSTLLIPDGGKP
jgi:hypothetical protein